MEIFDYGWGTPQQENIDNWWGAPQKSS